VLSIRPLASRDGVAISEVACRHPQGRGAEGEYTGGHAVVFVRRGCFVRSADGAETVFDPTVTYCVNPGEAERYDHPHGTGDDCTAINLDSSLVASLWGGEPELPAGPRPSSPQLDLEHRLLLAAARRGDDPDEVVEGSIALASRVLEEADPDRVAAGRPATEHARRALTDEVRELLAAKPDRSLAELAEHLAVSPHHLSRIFRAHTGLTVSRHRMQLRARTALERLASGERDLARLAADVGFADQSHLTRVLRSETGRTPSALRLALA
jgi:AraC-like DNA-binding protein